MTIDFMNPEYYDISTIHPDAPNKPLIEELFEAMNQQNERLWMFFTEMVEDPQWKPMKASMIKPRTLRKKRKAPKPKAIKPRSIDDVDSEEFEAGYKDFLASEFDSQ